MFDKHHVPIGISRQELDKLVHAGVYFSLTQLGRVLSTMRPYVATLVEEISERLPGRRGRD